MINTHNVRSNSGFFEQISKQVARIETGCDSILFWTIFLYVPLTLTILFSFVGNKTIHTEKKANMFDNLNRHKVETYCQKVGFLDEHPKNTMLKTSFLVKVPAAVHSLAILL